MILKCIFSNYIGTSGNIFYLNMQIWRVFPLAVRQCCIFSLKQAKISQLFTIPGHGNIYLAHYLAIMT